VYKGDRSNVLGMILVKKLIVFNSEDNVLVRYASKSLGCQECTLTTRGVWQ
jgi:hypothetical protein